MTDSRPPASPLPVGLYGASGKMGIAITELITREYAPSAQLVAAVTSSDPIESLADAAVILDFSLPQGTRQLLDWLGSVDGQPPTLVCGTTGLDDEARRNLDSLSRRTRVLQSNNFSAGVAALGAIMEQAAPMLRRLGYTPVLTETHHRSKKDAPSGTAKTLREVLEPQFPDGLAVHSIRAGEVIGKHDVTFYGRDDEIVIGHDAKDRRLFARGAIEAAIWLCQQPARHGRFTMQSYFRERYLD